MYAATAGEVDHVEDDDGGQFAADGFGDEGAKALASALRVNAVLKTLNLCDNNIRAEGKSLYNITTTPYTSVRDDSKLPTYGI